MLTTPPADREMVRSQNRGSRVYAIDGGEYPSVTSIISKGEPKPALVGWAKKVTAEAAIEQYHLVGKILTQDGDKAAIDHLKGAAYRQRDAAGDLGSRLHEVAEYEVVQGKPYPDQGDPQAQLLLEHFRDFVKSADPEWLAVEAIVYSEEHGYAGTLDAAAKMALTGDIPVLVDWKSGSGVYGSYALQLAAYAHASHILGPDGPSAWDGVSLEKAVVVHVRPNGWRLVQVDIGEPVFEAFLNTMRMAEWAANSDSTVGPVLATGRHLGGTALKKGKDGGHAVIDTTTVQEFGSRRRIRPPSLSK